MPWWIIFEILFLWNQQYLCFHYWDYLTNFWRNNWWSIIDGEERLCYLKGLELYIHITLIQNIYLWRGLSFLGLGLIAFGTGGNYVCKFMKWFQHFSNQIFFFFFFRNKTMVSLKKANFLGRIWIMKWYLYLFYLAWYRLVQNNFNCLSSQTKFPCTSVFSM